MDTHHPGVTDSGLRANQVQHTDSDDVHRAGCGLAQVHSPVGIRAVVMRRVRAVAGAEGRSGIQNRRAFLDRAVVNRRCVDNCLERRAGLTAMHGVVNLGLLVVGATDHGFDFAVFGV